MTVFESSFFNQLEFCKKGTSCTVPDPGIKEGSEQQACCLGQKFLHRQSRVSRIIVIVEKTMFCVVFSAHLPIDTAEHLNMAKIQHALHTGTNLSGLLQSWR
jgi:hypothetical protein